MTTSYLLIQCTKPKVVEAAKGWMQSKVGLFKKIDRIEVVSGPYDLVAEVSSANFGEVNKLIYEIYRDIPEVHLVLPCVGISQ